LTRGEARREESAGDPAIAALRGAVDEVLA
jgi:hypothetical protein